MGKKSKRKSKAAASGKKSSVSTALPSGVSSLTSEFGQLQIPSSTASCWVCLDDEPDDEGRPIVRDCACRGDSGWAHLSCLIDYAESKSKEYLKKNGPQFWGTGMLPDGSLDLELSDTTPWIRCANCKQGIRGQLMLDMSDALLDFTKRSFPLDQSMLVVSETSFPCDPFKYVPALCQHLSQLGHAIGMVPERAPALVEEVERVGEHTIAVLSEMNTAVNHSRVHRSQAQIINFEASVYDLVGGAHFSHVPSMGSQHDQKEGAMKAIKYFEKSKEKYIQTGDQDTIAFSVPNIDVKISSARQLAGMSSTAAQTKLNVQQLRKMEKIAPTKGGNLQLATALLEDKQMIASQRMLEKILANSRQVHGAGHVVSTGLEETYETWTQRRVYLDGSTDCYQLVSYISDEIAEVRGPVTWDNFNSKGRKPFTVNVCNMILVPPIPVVCQGLKGATHLNGEIGDARDFDAETQRYVVHFENPKLKKALVKQENLRALFDLPPRKEEYQIPCPTVGRPQKVTQRKGTKKCSV